MSIVRAPRPHSEFLIVSNAVVRDEKLSYRARGVLIDLLSRPDNWRTDAVAIARRGREGRDAIRAVLIELEEAGYLIRQRVRGPDGTFTSGDSLIYDVPQKPRSQPRAGNPQADSPQAVFQPSIEVPREEEPKKNQTQTSSSAADAADAASPEARSVCELLAGLMVANGSRHPSITSKWLSEARLLLTKDGRPLEEVQAVIRWCQGDDFWRSNILSMAKLRAKYDQLLLKSKGSSGIRKSSNGLLRPAQGNDQHWQTGGDFWGETK